MEEESDSDLDYGRDSDDSDDDYEESVKPWQQKGKKKPLPESSDDESMGVEDEQQAPAGSIQKQRTEDIEAELEDYHKVSIPRRRLIRWCNEPFFGKAVKNFYVRLNIGRDNKTQKPCYRLCKILAVVTNTEYSFPVDNQRPVSTTISHLYLLRYFICAFSLDPFLFSPIGHNRQVAAIGFWVECQRFQDANNLRPSTVTRRCDSTC